MGRWSGVGGKGVWGLEAGERDWIGLPWGCEGQGMRRLCVCEEAGGGAYWEVGVRVHGAS